MHVQAIEHHDPAKILSAVLTVAVHGVLALILFFGVQWQRRPPEMVMVDLVQPAAEPVAEPPKPVEPTPAPPPPAPPAPKPVDTPPPAPDIALKSKPQKPAPPSAPVASAPVAKPLDPLARLMEKASTDAARASAEAREQALLKKETDRLAQLATNPAITDARAAWQDAIRAKVRGNIPPPPPGISGRPKAEFELKLLIDGSLASPPRLLRSSGNPSLDALIERAIVKSSPLPLPAKKEAFDSTLKLIFDPYDPN